MFFHLPLPWNRPGLFASNKHGQPPRFTSNSPNLLGPNRFGGCGRDRSVSMFPTLVRNYSNCRSFFFKGFLATKNEKSTKKNLGFSPSAKKKPAHPVKVTIGGFPIIQFQAEVRSNPRWTVAFPKNPRKQIDSKLNKSILIGTLRWFENLPSKLWWW